MLSLAARLLLLVALVLLMTTFVQCARGIAFVGGASTVSGCAAVFGISLSAWMKAAQVLMQVILDYKGNGIHVQMYLGTTTSERCWPSA